MNITLVSLIMCFLVGTVAAQNDNTVQTINARFPKDPNGNPISAIFVYDSTDSSFHPLRLDSSGMLYVTTGSNIVRIINNMTDDTNLRASRMVILNPEQFHYTSTQIIVRDTVQLSEKGIFQMIGSRISGASYDYIKFFLTVNINDGKDVRFRICELPEYDSDEEYPLTNERIVLNTNYTYKSKASERYFELSDNENQNISIEVEINNVVAFVKLEASFGIDGGENPSISFVQVRQGNK